MTITIPEWVFIIPVVYFVIGLILYVPLNLWVHKFISPRRKGLDVFRDVRKSRVLMSLLGVGIGWPYMIKECVRWEYKYGMGKK